MKGLFIKDLSLILSRKQPLILFVAIIFVIAFGTEDSFLIGYGTMLFGIFALGTLSYDEHDNCTPFLLTLPVTRKEFVFEKYFFSSCGLVTGWILSILATIIASFCRQYPITVLNDVPQLLTVLLMFGCVISLLIPIQIKYGSDKSRVVMIVIAGVVILVVSLLKGIFESKLNGILEGINQISETEIILVVLLIWAVIKTISYLISKKVMLNKSY